MPSKPVQIHQFHPTVSFGDAISNDILDLRKIAKRLGYGGEVFCEVPPSYFNGRTRLISGYERYANPANILLLHFSLGYSPEVLSWLQRVPDRKVLVYHNITPHAYFEGVNDGYFDAALSGREQLSTLSSLMETGWGDSSFNCAELSECGWRSPAVLPIMFEPKRYATPPDRKILKRWQCGCNVLFVGRVSPNKKFEDLILTFYYLKRFVRPDARLILVGAAQNMETYSEFLKALIKRLGLRDVFFTGHVSSAELMAYYRTATVYLSMSEHEGFGVPLLESMYFDIPVVAYAAAAVPETLGGSGILVHDKNYAAIAELLGLLAEDVKLRERVILQQRKRLADFSLDKVTLRFKDLLGELGV